MSLLEMKPLLPKDNFNNEIKNFGVNDISLICNCVLWCLGFSSPCSRTVYKDLRVLEYYSFRIAFARGRRWRMFF